VLDSKAIEIGCECLQLTQFGQSGMFGDRVLPPFFYKFNWVDASDKGLYIHKGLQTLHDVPFLERKQTKKLKRAIAGAIRPLPQDLRPQLFPSFEHELLFNDRLVKAAVDKQILGRLGVSGMEYDIKMHAEGDDTDSAETDLHTLARIDKVEARDRVAEIRNSLASKSAVRLEKR
jgi:hypothetical protein